MNLQSIIPKKANRRRVKGLLCLTLLLVLAVQMSPAGYCTEGLLSQDPSGRRNEYVAVDPVGHAESCSAVLYDNSNGLPTSEANVIAQTSEGFLWIGCYGGLIRYDGDNFVRIDSSTGITSVRSLCVDSRDRLWIGTNDNGLFLMKDGETRRWGEEEGLQALSVRSILEDDTGLIYVASTGGLALIGEDLELRLPEDPRVRERDMHELRQSGDGLVYGLSDEGDVFAMHGGEMVWFLERGNSRFKGISSILPDPEHPGYMYIESKNGQVYHGKPDNGFTDADSIDIGSLQFVQEFNYIDGKLWVCAGNGVGYLDGQGFHMLENIPLESSVGSVTTDYEGNLWFTSSRQGVMKLVPNRFSNLFLGTGLSEAVVNSTCLYDGRLFIGTDTGLRVLNGSCNVQNVPLNTPQQFPEREETTDNLVELLEGTRIRSLTRDSHDRLWIATWRSQGLLRYDHGDLKVFTERSGLASERVRAVVERADGSFLVACTGGVSVIEDDRVTQTYGLDGSLGSADILTVCEGPEGTIFVGTDGEGIYIIDNAGTRRIDKGDGLHSGVVMRIKPDRTRDIYWIVTGNSLAWMRPDGQVTTLEHFPYFNNFDLYQNSEDVAWVLSGNGVYVLPTEEMLEDGDLRPIYFSVSNGLPFIPTSNSYSELTEEGMLYIAGSSGVIQVDIEAPMENVADLRMAVPFIDADGERLYPDEDGKFVVGPLVRKLTIYAYVYNYSLIDPQVTCRLEGFDQSSFTVDRKDLAPMDYTNLPGGVYRFTMELNDTLGGENNTLSVQIEKKLKLREQWWFYLLLSIPLAGLLAAGVSLYMRRRIRNLEEKHREEVEKERISTELGMANQIQNSMLPHIFPPFPDRKEFDIYASMDPAREVGGDFYDFFLIDDDHLCLVMADVSGKGIPAALFMMISKVILQSCAMLGKSAGEILTKTNEAICSDNQVDMFVTVWLGILEISTGKITAANAGHEYPVLKKNGQFELLKDRHGLVIGGMEGMRYKEYELQLLPGDKLFLYTDGVPEATDAGEQMFGMERMLAALNEAPEAAPETILKNVRGAVDGFVKDAEQFDDLTMLCLEYKGTQGEKNQ